MYVLLYLLAVTTIPLEEKIRVGWLTVSDTYAIMFKIIFKEQISL